MLSSPMTSLFFNIFILILIHVVDVSAIGVNYGREANNLPPATEVAKFLLKSTVINRVRLFDADPDTLRAFANTTIAVTVTVPNDDILLHLTNFSSAQLWLRSSVSPFLTAGTHIVRILVGNEVLSTGDKRLILSLVPAMELLYTALAADSLDSRVQVTSPHSLGLLSVSSPPSAARFRPGYDTHVIIPLLAFLRATGSPFMVNPYPFFGSSSETLDFALFRGAPQVLDELSNRNYTNMFDAQLDAVYSAMTAAGYGDVDIVVGETGWPSAGDPGQVGVDPESAAEYNGRLIQHVNSGVGTPLMPNRNFETYIFALFDENLKPGPTCERYFGLFKPDMTPSYDAGVLRRRPEYAACSNYPHHGVLLLSLIVLLSSTFIGIW